MAEALYRKYRPVVFDDVVGQKHILQTLKNAIASDKISHAYLFCGPRGTGKTTMARILAKACMCAEAEKLPTTTPCGKCEDCGDIAKGSHPDVYELDAASRTGVENVREEIISRVGFAATRGAKKIYIIDEVHMLSVAAFNALLKTLEEPPSHVIFVLCTTDPQKVPETILSRCQRFDFKPISVDEIAARLAYVCDAEGVEAEESALKIIASNAQGAMRNALTQLEQVISYSSGKITVDDVKSDDIDLSGLLSAIDTRNLKAAFDWIDAYCETGADFNYLTFELTKAFRNEYIETGSDRLHYAMIVMGELATELKTSPNARLSFEIAVAKLTRPESDLTLESLASRVSALEEGKFVVAPVEVHAIPEVAPVSEPVAEESFEPANDEVATPVDLPKVDVPEIATVEHDPMLSEAIPKVESKPDLADKKVIDKAWRTIFANIKKKYPAYGAILITASAAYNSETNQFIIEFPASNEFAMSAINKPDTLSKIHSEIKEVVGKNIGLDLAKKDNEKNEFNPSFTSDFRKEITEHAPVEKPNPVVNDEDKKDVKDILTSFGAINITEN